MATKKDLVEAHAFSRRRLVTAFVSGAPGGREVEPARPGRTIVGGLALSVLLVAGAAVAGFFSGRTPDDWTQPGLVQSKDTKALYVILDGEDSAADAEAEGTRVTLHPVINITSAKLILDSPTLEPVEVKEEDIGRQVTGSELGILGAPAVLPSPGNLVQSGWTACAGTDAAIRLAISGRPGVRPAPAAGHLVRVGREYHVLAAPVGEGARSYRVAENDGGRRDRLLRDIGAPSTDQAVPVGPDFLALFPVGGELSAGTFGLEGVGERPSYARDVPGVRIGDVVSVGETPFLIAPDGPQELDPFAAAVYGEDPVKRVDDLGVQESVGPWEETAHWPTAQLEEADEAPCAQLDARPDEPPRVLLAGEPGGAASPEDAPAGRTSIHVDPGTGAYVEAGGWTATDGFSEFLVDSNGVRYELQGPGTASALGYGDREPARVPDPWVELLRAGTPLSQDLALCPPGYDGSEACR